MKKKLNVMLSLLLCLVLLSALAMPAFAATGAVKNLKVSAVAPTSVTLKWSKASSAGGYEIQRAVSGGWRTVTTTKKTTAKVTDLTLGATYQFRVRAYRSVSGKLQYGAFSSVVSATTAPAKVSSFKAKAKTSNSLTLSWKASSGATGYRVQQYIDKAWVNIAKSTKKTTLAVKKLVPNKTYKFRVLAYIKQGGKTYYGAYTSLKVKTEMLPKPTSLKASAVKDTSVTLTWNAVPTAKKYIVYQVGTNTQKEIAKTTKTKLKIASLKAATDYMYAVRAVTIVDDRNYYSQFSSYLSVRTAPAQVKNLAVSSRTDTAVNLRWSKVSGAEGYEIWQYSNEKLAWVYIGAATGTTYSVSDLSAMTAYRFKVRAYHTVNGGKLCGAYTPELAVTTLMAPVSNLRFDNATGTTLTVSWNPISSATGYQVQIRTVDETAFRAATVNQTNVGGRIEAVISSLKENTDYVLRVCPIYAQSTGTEQLLLAKTAPAAVKDLKANKATGGITLSWTAVAGAQGYEVSKYTSGSSWKEIGTTPNNAFADSNVVTDTVYSYRVRPYYTIGAEYYYGAYSDSVSEKPLPPAVSGLAADTISETSFYVRWNSPQTSTSYRITISENGGSERNLQPFVDISGGTTSLLIDGLSAGGTYTVNVFNNISGVESMPASVTIKTRPGKVSGLTAGSITDSTITLSWTDVKGAERYEIQRGSASGADFTTVDTVASLPYRVTGLAASTDYTFRVRAINTANGQSQVGVWSEQTKAKTAAASSTPTAPAAPSGLTPSNVTDSAVTLKWNGVNGVSGYQISMADASGWRVITTTAATTYTVTSLSAGTTYSFRVASYIGSGSDRILSNPAVTSVTTTGGSQPVNPTDPTEPSGPSDPSQPDSFPTTSTPLTGLETKLDANGLHYTLRWNEVSGASYAVQRYNTATGTWETLTSGWPNGRVSVEAPSKELNVQTNTSPDAQTTVNWSTVTGAKSYEIRNELSIGTSDWVVTTGLSSPTAKLRLPPNSEQRLRISAIGQAKFRIYAINSTGTAALAYSEYTTDAYIACGDATINTPAAPAFSSAAGVQEAYALMLTQAINNTKEEKEHVRMSVTAQDHSSASNAKAPAMYQSAVNRIVSEEKQDIVRQITCDYTNNTGTATIQETVDGVASPAESKFSSLSSILMPASRYSSLYKQHDLSTFQQYVSSVSATKSGSTTTVRITLKPEQVTPTKALVYHPYLIDSNTTPDNLSGLIEDMKEELSLVSANATASVGATTIEAKINSNYTLDSLTIHSPSVITMSITLIVSTISLDLNRETDYTYTFTR